MNEQLHQYLSTGSPAKVAELLAKYSRLWWDVCATECRHCRNFDGYDHCFKYRRTVTDDILFCCNRYKSQELNENLQKIETEIIVEFPEYFKPTKENKKEMENIEHNFGYHTREIEKGVLGEFSKIKEEFEELEDAVKQDDPIMILCECSDLIGAIEKFTLKYNIDIQNLISFNKKTENAFKCNKR